MCKILAIDDDPDILFTLQAIGELGQFEMNTAENGPEGIKMLKKEPHDLVMVDYHMPLMNGLEVVKKIRKVNQDIPILVLTVDESLELADRFLEVGATDFAIKPIRAADLISRVKLLMRLSKMQIPDEVSDVEYNFDLPKGLTLPTLQIIIDFLKNIHTPLTLHQISDQVGLAYQTVHRYVDYLVKVEYVEVELNYGKVGRPIQKYLLKK